MITNGNIVVLGVVALQLACGEGPAVHLGEVPTAHLKELLRIDGEREEFGEIPWVGISPTGTISVLQPQDPSIRFFNAQGGKLATVGGRGHGPGEFQQPRQGGWRADTLWVSDLQAQRISLISPSLEVTRTFPLRGARWASADAERYPRVSAAFPRALYPGDTTLSVGFVSLADPLASRINGSPLLRIRSDGVVADLVHVLDPINELIRVNVEGGSAAAQIPFYHRPLFAIDSYGQRFVTLVSTNVQQAGGDINIRLYDAKTGSLIYDRLIPFTGVPIPTAVLDSITLDRATRATNAAVRRVIEGEARDRAPPIYPPVQRVLLALDGRAWLAMHADRDVNRWIVLDQEGVPVLQFTVPSAVDLVAAHGDHVWGVARDDLDVESVVGYVLIAGE